MVKKPRWTELTKRYIGHGEPLHPRFFSESQWQQHVSMWYLLYRWLMLGCWIVILTCSLTELGSFRPEGIRKTWFIYLTHWDLSIGVLQSLLGALLVSNRKRLQRRVDFDPDSLTLGAMERTYWCLYVITSTIAVGVTISYWCTVYDPSVHIVDPLNLLLHVCNSILMVIDCLVVRVPHRFEHVWWCLAFITFYLLFTLVYYLLGGLDKHGHHYIYKTLDWQKPGRTILVCVGGLLFIVAVHCSICFITRLRIRLASGRDTSATKTTPVAEKGGDEFQLPTKKPPEMIV